MHARHADAFHRWTACRAPRWGPGRTVVPGRCRLIFWSMRPDEVRKYSRPAETLPRSDAESREDDILDSPGVELQSDEILESGGPACAQPSQTQRRAHGGCEHAQPGPPGAGQPESASRCLRAATPVKRARKHRPGPAHRRTQLTGPVRRQQSSRC